MRSLSTGHASFSGSRGRLRARALLVVALFLATTAPARGQELIDLLVQERFWTHAHAAAARLGAPTPAPPVRLPTPADTVYARYAAPPPPPPVPVVAPFADATWRHVRRLEMPWFDERFGKVRRAFLGANGLSPLDTTWTRVLRGRLEERFGVPTRIIPDYDWEHAPPAEPFQFEYWFVVNDSIPFVVTDVGGPFERGLIVSVDARYRERLTDLRAAFLRELGATTRIAPYVDYVMRDGRWYRAGFDGTRFFVDPIPRPRVLHARPVLQQRE